MPFSDRTFDIKLNDVKSFSVRLAAPPLEAQGLRLDTWGGAFILSNLLYKIDLPKETLLASEDGMQVLELGSGTGLAGLSAAIVWKSSVVLTDLQGVIPGIMDNISLNSQLLKEHSAEARCGELDWRTPTHISLYPADRQATLQCQDCNKPGIILAADTMYSEEQPEILTQAIVAWLRRDRFSRVLICYPMRIAYIEYIQEFWQRMSEAGLEVVQEGQQELSDEDGFDDEKLCEWSVWRWSEAPLRC